MRRLILFSFFLACVASNAIGAGPLFRHGDPVISQEFENVYRDLRGKSSKLLTEDANASGEVVRYDQLKVLQVTMCTTDTSSSTTTTDFVPTGFSCSITPADAANKVLIFVNGSLYHQTAGFTGLATVYRNETNVVGAGTASLASVRHESSGGAVDNMGIAYLDGPLSTSEVTYSLRIKTLSGSGTTTAFSQSRGVMILVEVNGI